MARFNESIILAGGAYGRDANEADWKAGKDFHIMCGPYFSIRDLPTIKAEGNKQIVFLTKTGYTAFIIDIE
jgi:hypothetical protein